MELLAIRRSDLQGVPRAGLWMCNLLPHTSLACDIDAFVYKDLPHPKPPFGLLLSLILFAHPSILRSNLGFTLSNSSGDVGGEREKNKTDGTGGKLP